MKRHVIIAISLLVFIQLLSCVSIYRFVRDKRDRNYKEGVELYRQNKLLEDFGFNIGLPKIRPEVLVKEMRKDKKAVSGKIQFALPSGIGRMKSVAGNFGLKLNEKDVLKVLRAL